jgi:hypothetical protein
MHWGLPCSKEKVSIHDASRCCSPSCYIGLLLLRNSSYEGGPTRNFFLVKWFDSRFNLNSFDSIATDWFYIFLG